MSVIATSKAKDYIASGLVQLSLDSYRMALMNGEFVFNVTLERFDQIAGFEVLGNNPAGGLVAPSNYSVVGGRPQLEVTPPNWLDVSATVSGVLVFRDGNANGVTDPLLWWLPIEGGNKELFRSDFTLNLPDPIFRW